MNIERTKKVGDTEVKERVEGINTYNEAETALSILKKWGLPDKKEDAKTT